uniref:Secreted protein n=1 Tax=Sus scrofa TaxID=9823 RepID=A0A4X1SSJ3_PIG
MPSPRPLLSLIVAVSFVTAVSSSPCRGIAPGSQEDERAVHRAGTVHGGGRLGAQALILIGVRQRQAAAQDLRKHTAELLRGHVVQQRVDHGAQVEESVREGEEDHVCLEIGLGPVLLGFGRSHHPPNLVRHPADGQGHNDQP